MDSHTRTRTVQARLSPAHRVAADLDAYLGDPMEDGAGPFSYRAIVEAEERDELPPGAVEAVRAWGFPGYLVPGHLGGRLTTLEELFLVTRAVSRRSVTVAVMYGSGLLAVNPVWLWGDPRQQKTVAEGVLRGDLACFGVSEADHGSDVTACEARAEAAGDGLVLTGVKWPVGNATRGRFVTAYARTGPRDFSLLLVDKKELDPASWSALPPVRTVGLRGHDLSGVEFAGARLPAGCVIGRPGSGLVQTLKTLQITRTAIAALSLGTMDAVVRIGMEYAVRRTLYGAEIYRIPVIRDQLLKAHLDLLVAECVALPVARALTVAPGRLSLWSSVVKYFVPVQGEEVVAGIGRVLAARGYLREGVAHGAFQKLQRDHAIASVFEGTTHVNLANIAAQLPHLVEDGGGPGDGGLLADLFSWTHAPPAWRPDGRALRLTNEGRDEIGAHFEETAGAVVAEAGVHAAPGVAARLADLVDIVGDLRTQMRRGVMATPDDTSSVAALDRARRHCEVHAMVSCMLTWLHNHRAFGGAFADGQWLVLCLERLVQRARPDTALSEEFVPPVEEAMLRCRDARRWFSLTALADEGVTADASAR
ncbi:acyl-CoA dehydrogenase [Actinomadura sp. NBRC 104425]|uniref:acyl-CoA dehydrogenase family protein n=1 Tax=Actinomadura sp. NBRC 104425 TaxID=3032204 RepID=UPI0024A266C0|nr:acyl-CoA dehydrogenase family protein [Actinomadura sp. NBRC 104425]GLZ11349.1 acyl-CoA dehydrogenase [Actinomadura sp. NBRC 104425]